MEISSGNQPDYVLRPENGSRTSRSKAKPGAPLSDVDRLWLDDLCALTRHMIDSVEGYQKCAEMFAHNHELAQGFDRRAHIRQHGVKQLQNTLRRFGESPPRTGTQTDEGRHSFTQFSHIYEADQSQAYAILRARRDQVLQRLQHCLRGQPECEKLTRALKQIEAQLIAEKP